ncbi:indolepyruvate ferredoxin oxidoreductase family protein [Rhodospirillaceae bacterium KN72]|uniref:Indolepyruvate ferredoxin oxidoreductase family protein n=1 Tax=Pacificispira spongiicola TaxID=2729598 RepID=A0A7Y0HHW2_9PROT|nr:indolepyruvate ferredoxin oxidoreductase family protein [Pacificispira spongiicola]NMM45894.1 indolepyruvate ferredoxin oxidoreductase family protein [Pacificispira spongiicola]
MAELAHVSLDDKYTLEQGRVFLTGTQALVRLPLMQRARDRAAGLNTGCFISGYRGSPLGGFDQQLWRARKFLEKSNIHFQPGVNEDLAATAVWGTQQVGLYPGADVDGVFSIWYGKGPGVDRSGDVFRHANMAGTSKNGGVLVLAGDDHTSKSSTTAHQTEYAFVDAMMPVLNPANVQEFLDLGMHGWAMSRYSGAWVAFKTLADTVDTSASVYVDPHRVNSLIPTDFEMPPGGLNIRAKIHEPLAEEELHHKYRLYAALAYARANKLNYEVLGGKNRRLGIVTTGKSYLDVMQALEDLHIDESFAEKLGIVVYKVGMPWPLEREGIRHFAEGLEEILVVEEKRALIENQLKEQLYNWREDVRPRVVGKFDDKGTLQLPSYGELTPARIAQVLVDRLKALPGGSATVDSNEHFKNRLGFLAAKEQSLNTGKEGTKRLPYFCSGCPHNTSTKVPEGSRALAGIGCHYMALWMDRNTQSFSQMGGEGMTWVGQAPFTSEKHVFVNLGDGTYFHSGLLALRGAVSSSANITYKILFNDAVAMTGGQPHDGPIDVPTMAAQVYAEGIKRLAIVSDEPEKYPQRHGYFPPGTTVHHRSELDHIQKEFRETEGCTVIIYDQTCAAEKRRRRKRGLFPDPAKRAFINDAVCEGCGDCSVKSNCMSVVPKETEFGRKREIDQSSCNKDYSCVDGFCPSFVTVHGGKPRKGKGAETGSAKLAGVADVFETLPEPIIPSIEGRTWDIVLTGIGGTGVVTIGALLGMAAHIEGKGCSVLDMAGLAQKGGPVVSHIRIAKTPEDIKAVRIAAGGADLILGCDMVVASGVDTLAKAERGVTKAVVNTHQSVTGAFTRNPDWQFPAEEMERIIRDQVGPDAANFVPGTQVAEALMGDTISTNPFMMGVAYQMGLLPVSGDAIEEAIALNGVAVEANKRAFLWGRRMAHDSAAVIKLIGKAAEKTEAPHFATKLEDIVAKRIAVLKDYQNTAYARRYKDLVDRVVTAEARIARSDGHLAKAVARYYFKLLAIKDEYEVARLYTNGDFLRSVRDRFEGDYKLHFHLAPPLFADRDPDTGELKKKEYGPWMMSAFGLLAKLRFLRGTAFDIFGRTDERKMERQLIADYEAMIEEILNTLTSANYDTAIELAALPEKIRGFGHVKERHVALAKKQESDLLARYRNPSGSPAEPAPKAAE